LWLSAEVGTGAGDVAGGAEYRPTDAQSQTLGELEKDLIDAKAAFAKFMGEVKAFNAAHAGLALSDELKAERSKAVVLP
jgi:hypothetical protein